MKIEEYISCDENISLSEILLPDSKNPSVPHGPWSTVLPSVIKSSAIYFFLEEAPSK